MVVTSRWKIPTREEISVRGDPNVKMEALEWVVVICACVALLSCLAQSQEMPLENPVSTNVTFDSQDRILVLAPHPDDEVLGSGGIIQRAVQMKLPLRIVFFTYGDSNEWSFLVYRKHPVLLPKAVKGMGLVRYKEALEAAKILGVSPGQLTFLGYPDFRTLEIWCCHWGDRPPAESMFTRVKAVPYPNAFRPGAPYKGEEITDELTAIIREFRPTKIFVSHPADHNSDHKSLYLFLRVVLWDLEKEVNPAMYPYLVHYRHWPTPRGYHPDDKLAPPQLFEQKTQWESFDLDPAEIERKHDALEKHKSQYEVNKRYLLSFVRSNEIFGDLPEVPLSSSAPAVQLSPGYDKFEVEPPEQLLDEERAAFIGIRQCSARLENGRLVLSIRLSRPLGKQVGASVYVFGYRKDRSFEQMPKLQVKFGEFEHRVYDQDRILPIDAVRVGRHREEITIEIPLELLGNPERILTSAHTYLLGLVPLDWVSWRVLRISY
jgi:LmbE family N-acetylglucosaminyl deacetylase